jgi:hypothetical protein
MERDANYSYISNVIYYIRLEGYFHYLMYCLVLKISINNYSSSIKYNQYHPIFIKKKKSFFLIYI